MPRVPRPHEFEIKPLKVLIILMAHKPTLPPNVHKHKIGSFKKAWRLVPLLRVNPSTKTKLLAESIIFDKDQKLSLDKVIIHERIH